MKITEIYTDSLFAIHFDEKDQNEYEAAFSLWQDLLLFLKANGILEGEDLKEE